MSSQAEEPHWNGQDAQLVETYDATGILGTPFKVLLKNSVKVVTGENGEEVETIIPDPNGLVKAVALLRVMQEQKLGPADLRFLRSALGLKAKAYASMIQVSPEHLSRLESGVKPLSPPTEMLVRMSTFMRVMKVMSTKAKAEIMDMAVSAFVGLKVKPCRLADDDLVLSLVRMHCDQPADDDDGLWNTAAAVA